MKAKRDERPASTAQRQRSQGYWAMVIGFIVLAGCLVGAVQLWIYGAVSIRPGHEPAGGDSAVGMLVVSGMVGVLVTAYGVFQVYRVRRMSMR